MKLTQVPRKAIIGVLLLAFLAGCAAPATDSPAPPAIWLMPVVKGCAETSQGKGTRASGEEQEPTIEVKGNTIRYSRAIQHQCCRKIEFEYTLEGALLTLDEVWSGEGCRCECFSEMEAALENIPAGNYTLRVYERGTQPGSNEPMEARLIIEQEISVP